MATGYLSMLEKQAALFGDLLRVVADPANHPVVIHCTAGKDRTGLGAALLLGAVGVDRDTIITDYALTDEYRSKHRLEEIRPQIEAQGLDLDDLKVLFTAPAETMAATLAGVDERWGGIDGYLTGPAGVSAVTLDDAPGHARRLGPPDSDRHGHERQGRRRRRRVQPRSGLIARR